MRQTNRDERNRNQGTMAQPGDIGAGSATSNHKRVIMVVDDSADRSLSLKSLIEFMDAPTVRITDPSNWQENLNDDSLAAVFVPRDLPDERIRILLEDIGRFDPNVPIVLVDAQSNA